jgi:hypothetical protein
MPDYKRTTNKKIEGLGEKEDKKKQDHYRKSYTIVTALQSQMLSEITKLNSRR